MPEIGLSLPMIVDWQLLKFAREKMNSHELIGLSVKMQNKNKNLFEEAFATFICYLRT